MIRQGLPPRDAQRLEGLTNWENLGDCAKGKKKIPKIETFGDSCKRQKLIPKDVLEIKYGQILQSKSI